MLDGGPLQWEWRCGNGGRGSRILNELAVMLPRAKSKCQQGYLLDTKMDRRKANFSKMTKLDPSWTHVIGNSKQIEPTMCLGQEPSSVRE